MTAISDAQIGEWRAAIGRTETDSQWLDTRALRRYARAVGLDDETADAPLPHWAFFLNCPRDEEIGPDGHPRRGGFLPAITLPRRMFAASTIRFDDPIDFGAEGQLTLAIADVTHKSGRTGDLVFVEVDRTLIQDAAVRVRERQTFVYRSEGAAVPMPDPAPTAPEGELWQPDEVNLFRFSAATFNSHRIHYDLPYAREVEGYPALVIHGPFTAARLAALAMREGPLAEFSFRAMAPLFLGQPVYLRQASAGQFEAIRCDGTVAMQATASYR